MTTFRLRRKRHTLAADYLPCNGLAALIYMSCNMLLYYVGIINLTNNSDNDDALMHHVKCA